MREMKKLSWSFVPHALFFVLSSPSRGLTFRRSASIIYRETSDSWKTTSSRFSTPPMSSTLPKDDFPTRRSSTSSRRLVSSSLPLSIPDFVLSTDSARRLRPAGATYFHEGDAPLGETAAEKEVLRQAKIIR